MGNEEGKEKICTDFVFDNSPVSKKGGRNKDSRRQRHTHKHTHTKIQNKNRGGAVVSGVGRQQSREGVVLGDISRAVKDPIKPQALNSLKLPATAHRIPRKKTHKDRPRETSSQKNNQNKVAM